MTQKGYSELRTLKSKKVLKKNKSKRQLELIERSKRRNNDKSMVKEKKLKQRMQSPNKKTLKRIKSSTGLHEKNTYQI